MNDGQRITITTRRRAVLYGCAVLGGMGA
ncbi:MAG: hypothetical protein RLZZ612_568, partial [Pseudomonadota bacterium]